jgi:transcriptional antiterminator RfaH
MTASWFVARVKMTASPSRLLGASAQAEAGCQVILPIGAAAEGNLARQGFRVLLPRVRQLVMHRGKKIIIEHALFPGYIFVEFSLVDRHWRAINSTIGVVHLLPLHLEIPFDIPASFVEGLEKYANDPMEIVNLTVNFIENDMVRLITGPFANFSARVLRPGIKTSLVEILSLTGEKLVARTATANLASSR